jgi:excisionase family DNA binding protein
MINPFQVIEQKLSNIETLLLDIKHQSATVETDHPDQLLTIQQAAEFLRLSVPTLYSKCSKSEIPYMKRSKRLYFSREQLTEYIKSGRKLTNAEIEQQTDQYLTNKKGRA